MVIYNFVLSWHIRSTVLDQTQSPFSADYRLSNRASQGPLRLGLTILTVTAAGEELPRGENYPRSHWPFKTPLPSHVLFMSTPKRKTMGLIKLPWEVSLVGSSHVPQFHTPKLGKPRGHLAESGSGISRRHSAAQATGDLISKPPLSTAGLAFNPWTQKEPEATLRTIWSHPLLLLMRKLSLRTHPSLHY